MKFYMCQIGIDLFEKIILFKSVILKILPEHIESEMCIDQNIKKSMAPWSGVLVS